MSDAAVWVVDAAPWYASGSDRHRGDVPGWVLVTLMTAGLVTALWLVADDKLKAAVQRRARRRGRQRALTASCQRVLARDDRGSAVVEFTLVGVLLTVLFLALLQLGLALHVRNTLVASAAEGARYAANADRTPDEGAAVTRQPHP